MEEVFERVYNGIKRKDKILLGIFIGASIVGLGLFCWFLVYLLNLELDSNTSGIIGNIVASFIGVVAVFVLMRLLIFVLHLFGDKHKVSYRNQDMWNQYGDEYRHIFPLNQSDFVVYFEEQFRYAPNKTTLVVKDDPKDFFVIDPFIKFHCFTLLEAHAMSKKLDSVTVRLTNVEKTTKEDKEIVTISTGRSSYLAHLLTNRALDYLIEGEYSIRKLYEHDKKLRPLRRSQLSNHLGINILVFLTGEEGKRWLLLPHRGRTATVAKNSVTASVAARVEMDDYENMLDESDIIKGCSISQFAKSLWIDEAVLGTPEVHFLGLSRDIYEGGKPTLFYYMDLEMTPNAYKKAQSEWLETKMIKKREEKETQTLFRLTKPDFSIDEVKKIHIADWSSVNMTPVKQYKWFGEEIKPEHDIHDIRLDSAKLYFEDEKKKEHKVTFEQNLIANFWFLDQWLNEQKKSQ